MSAANQINKDVRNGTFLSTAGYLLTDVIIVIVIANWINFCFQDKSRPAMVSIYDQMSLNATVLSTSQKWSRPLLAKP